MGDAEERPIGTRVVLSEEAYKETRNIAPDLSVFFGGSQLAVERNGGIGKIHSKENDTGPDGANHNWDGILLMTEGKDLARSRETAMPAAQGMRLYDVAPTVLEAFKIARLPKMQGSPIRWQLAHAV